MYGFFNAIKRTQLYDTTNHLYDTTIFKQQISAWKNIFEYKNRFQVARRIIVNNLLDNQYVQKKDIICMIVYPSAYVNVAALTYIVDDFGMY